MSLDEEVIGLVSRKTGIPSRKTLGIDGDNAVKKLDIAVVPRMRARGLPPRSWRTRPTVWSAS
jgi:hypothetical protein